MYSHSKINTFKNCQRQYKYRYIDELDVIDKQDAQDARIIGNLFHIAIEKGIEYAINWYYNQYYIITDLHITEVLKLELLYPKIKKLLSEFKNIRNEVKWEYDEFRGIIDIIGTKNNNCNYIIDIKYSNNINYYLKSDQLTIYCYFLQQLGYKIDKLGFLFIPKSFIRQKKSEDMFTFRSRLKSILDPLQPQIIEVPYNDIKINEFLQEKGKIEKTRIFYKNETRLCDYCDYQQYCKTEGEINYMILPPSTRKEIIINITPDMWLYGNSYVGKTVFVDSFDKVLFINTDGNIDHVSSAVIQIKDEIKTEGRIIKRRFAWEVFKEVLTELEKKQNDFKIVSIDLIEDLYEHCRIYMYDKLKIEHESDSGFGKGYDMVKTEFLSTLKRLKNCGYQMILISKEIKSEIIKKGGEKLTTIKPNLSDKLANIISGTVDLSARIVAEGSERYLSFKASEYIFGGGRYDFKTDKVELSKDKFLEVLKASQNK